MRSRILVVARDVTLRARLARPARPEFAAPWIGGVGASLIALSRLDRRQSGALAAQITTEHLLTHELLERTVAQADGVPLFIEELTRAVLEAGLAPTGGASRLAVAETLQASLTARLDHLPAAKTVAQIGAAIGRSFFYELTAAVAQLPEAVLSQGLEQLVLSGLVFQRGAPPEASYTFKHALVQDAAYESLPKSQRQVLHRRIAETLRDNVPSVASAEPEVIAHHFTQAGLDELAIDWWGNAGNVAMRRSAFKQAIAHLGKAIMMGDKLAQGSSAKPHASSRLRLQIAYANALITARGPGAPETTAAFRCAREFAAGIEDAAERFSVCYGLWVGSLMRGELAIMQESASAILRDCENRPQSSEAGIAHCLSGVTNWFSGDFEEALVHLEQALTIFDPERDRDLAFRFGQDIGVSAMAYSALVLWPLGQVDRAHQLAGLMAARASQCGHVATTAYAAVHTVVRQIVGRSPVRAAPHIETIVRLARHHEMPLWIAFGNFLEPWARWHLGTRDASLTEMRRGVAIFREVLGALYVPLVETALAEVEAEAGQIGAAIATLDRAVAETDRTGQRWYKAESQRLRGGILLMRDPANPAPAEDAFLAAIAIAQQQRARSFELRAALGLSELYHTTDRNADAHAVLAPALEGFSPTPEFPEIEQARVLLANLDAIRSDTPPR